MIKKIVTITMLLLHLVSFSNSKRLTNEWLFKKQKIGGIYEVWRSGKHDFSGWTKTTLPHCVNGEDAVDPDTKYYQGETWYKTHLKIENPYKEGRTILEFEGAGQKTTVYTYLSKIGEHVGGYDEFKIDLTESLDKFSKNKLFKSKYKLEYPIAICTDNSRDLEMMPSDLADFNIYGGIYRYLNLVYVPAISIDYFHITPIVKENGEFAEISIDLKIYNPDKRGEKLDFEIEIFSPEGKAIKKEQVSKQIFIGKKNILQFKLENPILWSPDSPKLYKCKVSLKSKFGEHKLTEKFGCKYFEFKKRGPFYLNGKRLLLRGTHRHEDHAGVGAAMTEEQIKTEMKLIKDMGCNFIRLGHYQQSSIVLEECDRLGILVWEEIPWCRGGLGGSLYQEQGKRMLRNMINQHYNHASVIIWGLGNENDWPGDYEVFDKEAIKIYMKELHELSHKLDSQRKTSIRRCSFCADIVDVYSPSIWAGWYRGKFTDYKKVSRMEMEKVDRFIHVEWGASSHARRHSEYPDKGLEKISSSNSADERDGDFLLTGGSARASKDSEWSETYACNVFEWHLKEQETMDWLTGTAQWIFKDYSTPIRPNNPIPYVNQKGVIERDFTKKESYYVFQSYWTKKPMVRIYGHSWKRRWGEVGDEKVIKVYSNCDEVKLIVNGKSLGKKVRDSQDFPAAGLRWSVILNSNQHNKIEAIGFKDDKIVKDNVNQYYQTEKWGKPAQLSLNKISEDENTVTLEAILIDKNGIQCLDARNQVDFTIAGEGELIDNQGTSRGASKVQVYNARAIITIKKNNGKSVVGVISKGITPAFININ
jgi:beta-galactosidase